MAAEPNPLDPALRMVCRVHNCRGPLAWTDQWPAWYTAPRGTLRVAVCTTCGTIQRADKHVLQRGLW